MKYPDIAAGQVIRFPSDQSCYRILWLEPSPGSSYWIRLDSNENIPKAFDFEDLANGLSDGRAEYAVDTWSPSLSGGAPSIKAIQTRDRLWRSIREAAQCEPAVYVPSLRAELLRKAELDSGVKMQNLYKILGRYWRRGKVPDALLPDFRNCGKSWNPYSGSGKRNGRPKQEGAPGKKLTQDDLQCFHAAVQKYYLDEKKVTLSDTYEFMLADSYSVHREGQEPEIFPADEIPSFPQFRYWYYKNRDILKEVREREGERSYQLNNRAVTGRTEEVLRGPGSAGQIDATIADIYLVRQNDRSAIVGRPTLYFVKDAATRMIMGMHVTLDPPSWRSAAMAIMNTAEDKVRYCKSFGIEIRPEEWPCQHLPGTILADRGEMEGSIADCLVMELGVTIENAPPYRGDLKGIIEKNFDLIDLAMTDLLPGKVKKDFGQRCARDYRLDARLDIRQFTAIIIRCVLFYNNSHYMEYFERTSKMKQMGVLPVPLDIWNFGIRYQVGVPRWVAPEKVRFSLLPKDHASITEHGIHFRGMYYTCSTAVSEHWYEQARTAGVRMVTAAYDPRNAAFIYILVSQDKEPLECRLISHNEAYSGIQHAEIASEQGADRAEKAVYEYRELGAEVKLKDFIKKTIEDAEKMAPDTIKQSKAQRIASIKKNREAEMEELASAEAGRTFEKAPSGANGPSPDSGKEVSFMTRMLRDVLNEARGRKGGTDDAGSKKAEYLSQDIFEFRNNPFIEALPPLADFRRLGAQLTVRPPYSIEERFLPDEVRLMLTQRIAQFHQPSDIDIDLASRFARCIRWGYLNRNPFSAAYASHLAGGYVEASSRTGINYTGSYHPNTYGFAVIGVSGIGKTITVERILSLYPQVVEHTEYNGVPLITKQVVWMKIDCPCDGTLKGLCTEFFRELDRLLGTDYLNIYSRRRATLDRMVSAISQLVYVHNVGILVFDELQNLGAASKGTSETALNFFVTLVNTSGVPVVMMGTPKILSILQKEFQQAKRGSGQGDLLWPRMKPGEAWDLFVESMWDYQYTKECVPLTRSFINALYDESQGIPFLAVHTYKLVQEDAILSGKETFHEKDISRIAGEKLGLTRPMREAIKRGQEFDVRQFIDISDFKAADYVRSCGISRSDADVLPSRPSPVTKATVLDEAVVTLIRLGLSPASARSYAASVYAEKNGHVEAFQIAQEAFLKYNADATSSRTDACCRSDSPLTQAQGYDDLVRSGLIAEEAV